MVEGGGVGGTFPKKIDPFGFEILI
jgi:hypothetical protein